jgi:hypothetical protein
MLASFSTGMQRPEHTVAFVRQMLQTTLARHRALLLAVLQVSGCFFCSYLALLKLFNVFCLQQATTSEAVLNQFVVRKGLYALRMYLEDDILLAPQVRALLLLFFLFSFFASFCLGQILAVLAQMPIKVKNVITSSKLEDTVKPLVELPDTCTAASALLSSWETLSDVFVIPRCKVCQFCVILLQRFHFAKKVAIRRRRCLRRTSKQQPSYQCLVNVPPCCATANWNAYVVIACV